MWGIVYEENVCREDGYGASDMVGARVEKGSLWGLVGGAEHGVCGAVREATGTEGRVLAVVFKGKNIYIFKILSKNFM